MAHNMCFDRQEVERNASGRTFPIPNSSTIIHDKVYTFFEDSDSENKWNMKCRAILEANSKHTKAESTHYKVMVWVPVSVCVQKVLLIFGAKHVKRKESDGWKQNTVSYLVLNFYHSLDPLCMVFEWLVVVVVSLWSFLFWTILPRWKWNKGNEQVDWIEFYLGEK